MLVKVENYNFMKKLLFLMVMILVPTIVKAEKHISITKIGNIELVTIIDSGFFGTSTYYKLRYQGVEISGEAKKVQIYNDFDIIVLYNIDRGRYDINRDHFAIYNTKSGKHIGTYHNGYKINVQNNMLLIETGKGKYYDLALKLVRKNNQTYQQVEKVIQDWEPM